MGMRPVVEMQFIDFISCAYDMITNYIATSRYRGSGPQPMVIRGPSGGGVRGGPFHSQNPEMAFFHTPGLKIVYPATAYDAKGLIKAAIRDDDPVLFFEHKWLYRRPQLREVLPDEDYVVPLGKARIHREGTDLTIVTYAAMVHKSLEAAEVLEKEDGLSVEVSTCAPAAAGRGRDRREREEDEPPAGRARGHPHRRDRGRDRDAVNEKAFEWLDAPILRVTASTRRCRTRRRWRTTSCRRWRTW
jgi:pyruvate/2-oxoglutarate/acetoin dehydrogenase E1 component